MDKLFMQREFLPNGQKTLCYAKRFVTTQLALETQVTDYVRGPEQIVHIPILTFCKSHLKNESNNKQILFVWKWVNCIPQLC